MYVVAVTAIALTSCSSIKNMAVPTMDTAVNMTAKKGVISDEDFNHWSHADLATDSIPGMSLDKAYKFVEGKESTTVIVGVIDSGIDIEHEDLKDVLWVNTKEIPANGIDDDKNGYVDDVNGWNFLGGYGVAAPEQLEITRLYAKYKSKFEGKTAETVSADEKAEFELFQKYEKAYTASAGSHIATMSRLTQINDTFKNVMKAMGTDSISLEALKAFKSDDEAITGQVAGLVALYERGATYEDFKEYFDSQSQNKSYDLV